MSSCATPIVQPTPPSSGGSGGLTGITIEETPTAKLFDISYTSGTGVQNFSFELFPQYNNRVWATAPSTNPAGISSPDYRNLTAHYLNPTFSAGQYLTTDASGNLSWASVSGGGGGTVTSVGMTVPSILSVSGSPITSSGTFAITLATQTANLVFASPSSGGASAPTFRALVANDIPGLDAGKITSGILPISRGGTGLNAVGTAGTYLKSTGTGMMWDTVTASPASPLNSIQYNNGGSFGGSSAFTYDGTTVTFNATSTTYGLGVKLIGTGTAGMRYNLTTIIDTGFSGYGIYATQSDSTQQNAWSIFTDSRADGRTNKTAGALYARAGQYSFAGVFEHDQNFGTTRSVALVRINGNVNALDVAGVPLLEINGKNSSAVDVPTVFWNDGTVGFRTSATFASHALGRIYMPWLSTDSGSTTFFAGSSNTGNNSIAVYGMSYSSVGVRGASTTNIGIHGSSGISAGVRAESTSGYGLQASSSSSNAIYASNSSSSDCIYATSNTGKAINAVSTANIAVQAGSSMSTGLYAYSTSGHGIVAESYGTNGRCVNPKPYHTSAFGIYVDSQTTGSSRTAPLIYAQSAETNDFAFIQCYDTSGSVPHFEVRRGRGTKVRSGLNTAGNMSYVGGRILSEYSASGNSGTTETTTHGITIAPNILATNGDSIEFVVVVTFASNTNNKRVRLTYGGTQIYDSTSQAQNGGQLILKGLIVRTGTATQKVVVQCIASGTLFADEAQYTTTSNAVTSSFDQILVLLTGGASNDATTQLTIGNWMPNGN